MRTCGKDELFSFLSFQIQLLNQIPDRALINYTQTKSPNSELIQARRQLRHVSVRRISYLISDRYGGKTTKTIIKILGSKIEIMLTAEGHTKLMSMVGTSCAFCQKGA